MKKFLIALALAVAACGDAADKDEGPTEAEMKAAASNLLEVSEEKITDFKKGECRSRDEGYVCTFEMYIAFAETPTKQALDKGYFFKSGEDWVMELVG